MRAVTSKHDATGSSVPMGARCGYAYCPFRSAGRLCVYPASTRSGRLTWRLQRYSESADHALPILNGLSERGSRLAVGDSVRGGLYPRRGARGPRLLRADRTAVLAMAVA